MSCSKLSWPNPEVQSDYAHLSLADNRQLAWELLRRNKDYQTDVQRMKDVTELAKAEDKNWQNSLHLKLFNPPLKPGESEEDWLKRAFYSGSLFLPPVKLSNHLAGKWHLKELVDFRESYSERVSFITAPNSPMRPVQTLDQFIALTDEFGGDEEPYVEAVQTHLALVAFDLRLPDVHQIASVKALLKKLRQERNIKAKHISCDRTDNHIRHLRVLDLISRYPEIGDTEITAKIGYDPDSPDKDDVGSLNLSQIGKDWREQAFSAQKKYRLLI